MSHILRIFFTSEGGRPLVVLLCLTLGALVQGVGLASMLPVISVVLDADEGSAGNSTQMVLDAVEWLGLPLNVYLLLTISVSAIILKNVLTLLAMVYVGYSVAQIGTSLRRNFLERLLQVRWSYLTERPMGEITNAISNDAGRAALAYQSAANFLVNGFQVALYILLALFVSWQITLISMIAGAGIAALMSHFIRLARKAGREQTVHTSKFVTHLSDALNNVKPIKAMDRQGNVANLLSRGINRMRKAQRRQIVSSQALKNGNEALAAIVMGLVLAAAIGLWEVKGPELVLLAFLLARLVGAINKLQGEYQKAVIFESAYDNVSDRIVDLEARMEADRGRADPVFQIACKLEDVHFAHPGRPVLQGVTLTFQKNRTTVLTGPSGSGKTTVADLILGFIAPDQGQVLIDDKPLSEVSLKAWRRKIGYVPQELVLFNETIHDNITLGDPDLTEDDVRDALRIAGGLGFVEALPDGIHTQVGEKGARISGGQRQRIALARALVEKPELLILDEVTSALDPATEVEIVANIGALRGTTTIIAITHRAALLEAADEIYALRDGRLAETSEVTRAAEDVV
ncbi:MAG: ABC transporter ATP-binding protein [Pseudomonadota bacterium]